MAIFWLLASVNLLYSYLQAEAWHRWARNELFFYLIYYRRRYSFLIITSLPWSLSGLLWQPLRLPFILGNLPLPSRLCMDGVLRSYVSASLEPLPATYIRQLPTPTLLSSVDQLAFGFDRLTGLQGLHCRLVVSPGRGIGRTSTEPEWESSLSQFDPVDRI